MSRTSHPTPRPSGLSGPLPRGAERLDRSGGAAQSVLVTGFPNALATAVILALLRRRPAARIAVLVPEKAIHAYESLLQSLPAPDRARLRAHRGDVWAIDFGLSGHAIVDLLSATTHIHHCAHINDPRADRRELERLHVGGTAEVVRFATDCKQLARFVMHSTAQLSRSPQGHAPSLMEWVGLRPNRIRVADPAHLDLQEWSRTLEQTRARSEAYVRAHMDRIPTTILRPTTIAYHEPAHPAEARDPLYRLIGLLEATPLDLVAPNLGQRPAHLNVVPVRYAAEAAVELGDAPATQGGVYHVADPAPPLARDALAWIAGASTRRMPRAPVPSPISHALLRAPFVEQALRSPRRLLEELAHPVEYPTENSRVLVESAGVSCAHLSEYAADLLASRQAALASARATTPRRGNAPPKVDAWTSPPAAG